MSVLHFDMCRKLRKAFAEFEEQALRDAQQAARTNEQLRWYARKDFVAPALTTNDVPASLSVVSSVADPTDQGETP